MSELDLLTDEERRLWKFLADTSLADPILIDSLFQHLIAARAENKRGDEVVREFLDNVNMAGG